MEMARHDAADKHHIESEAHVGMPTRRLTALRLIALAFLQISTVLGLLLQMRLDQPGSTLGSLLSLPATAVTTQQLQMIMLRTFD